MALPNWISTREVCEAFADEIGADGYRETAVGAPALVKEVLGLQAIT